MKKNLFLLVFIWFTTNSSAQLHELGLSFGRSNYAGDIGPTALINPNSGSFGVIYKYIKNPRTSYRISLSSMGIVANDSDSKNEIRREFDLGIDKKITELTAGIDFNFLEYKISHWKRAHTPYLIFEFVAFHYKKAIGTKDDFSYNSKIGVALPFGAGYKVQISDSFVIAFEVKLRYSFTDDLDDSQFYKDEFLNDNPENSKFGNTKSKDWYTFAGFTVTYTFGRTLFYTTRR